MHTRLLSPIRLLAVASVAAIAALGLVACGGDDETATTAAETTATETTPTSGGGGAAQTLSFEADPSGALAYTEAPETAKAGQATIEFDNPSSVGHDVVIEDESGNEVARTEVITDSTTTASAELEPGTDTYYCSVPGHREAGMEGTFTVK
ncbi:MAG TPA: plastocyanin/azurin family copper-binding protein [Solirubrobacterales bacterium]|nr:plastocyanin/azurin family copper-binding protein [Solirubrobacterales bacterium]